MQELIDSLNAELLIKNKNPQLNEWYRMAIKSYILIANSLLEKEKEQIINAFENGWNWNFSAEKYYNETYNNENTNSDSRL